MVRLTSTIVKKRVVGDRPYPVSLTLSSPQALTAQITWNLQHRRRV